MLDMGKRGKYPRAQNPQGFTPFLLPISLFDTSFEGMVSSISHMERRYEHECRKKFSGSRRRNHSGGRRENRRSPWDMEFLGDQFRRMQRMPCPVVCAVAL